MTARTELRKAEEVCCLHPQSVREEDHQTVMDTISLAERRDRTLRSHYVRCGRRGDIAREMGNAAPAPLASYFGRWVCMVSGDVRVVQPMLTNA